MRKCKSCKQKFEPKYSSVQQTCSISCAIDLTNANSKKKWKKAKAKRKKELMTLQDWIKIAQSTFNRYINLRDKGFVCISCAKPITGRVNASHYYNANNHWNVRFNEDNVHSSCINCNQFLHGNLIPYREYLIQKIGLERFDNLESISKANSNYSIESVKEINELYKQKIKDVSHKTE